MAPKFSSLFVGSLSDAGLAHVRSFFSSPLGSRRIEFRKRGLKFSQRIFIKSKRCNFIVPISLRPVSLLTSFRVIIPQLHLLLSSTLALTLSRKYILRCEYRDIHDKTKCIALNYPLRIHQYSSISMRWFAVFSMVYSRLIYQSHLMIIGQSVLEMPVFRMGIQVIFLLIVVSDLSDGC
jgi:hypothetical protein